MDNLLVYTTKRDTGFLNPRVSRRNFIFVCHTTISFVILLAFAIVTLTFDYFGDLITCVPLAKGKKRAISTYCSVLSIYVIERGWNPKYADLTPYPGIIFYQKDDVYHYLSYYLLVSLIFFVQGIIWYSPQFLLKLYKRHTLPLLVDSFDINPVDGDKEKKAKYCVEYLLMTRGQHTWYFYTLVMVELLNPFIDVLQMYYLSKFLGEKFVTLGIEFAEYLLFANQTRLNPIIKIFPVMSMCNFYELDMSGNIMKSTTLCALPVNAVNGVFCLFLWYWIMFLVTLAFINTFYRASLILSPRVRYLFLRHQVKLLEKQKLYNLCMNISIGDWYLIFQLSKYLDKVHFAECLRVLCNSDKDDEIEKNDSKEKSEDAEKSTTSGSTETEDTTIHPNTEGSKINARGFNITFA